MIRSAWQAATPWQRFGAHAVLVAAVVAVVILATSTPAFAVMADPNIPGWTEDASNYLVTKRWSPVTFAPSGNLGFGAITSFGPVMMQYVFIAIGEIMTWVFMTGLSLSSGGSLVEWSANSINDVFATVGRGLLGNDNGALLSGAGVFAVSVMLIALISVTAWHFIRGRLRHASFTLVGGLAAMFALIVMSGAARDDVANYEAAGAGSEPAATAFSPKWFIGYGDQAATWVGNQTAAILTGIADSFDDNEVASVDECEAYISAMHATYLEKQDAFGAANVIVAVDSLMTATMWENVRVATMGGDSASSDASWCRYSEMAASAPLMDQVALSRTAGLYSDIVGFNATESIYDKVGSVTNGSAVNADGTVTDEELLADIFGPAFSDGDSSSRAMYFWAACVWPEAGGAVQTNPAWEQVHASAATNDSFLEALSDNAAWGIPGIVGVATVIDMLDGSDVGPLGESGSCEAVVQEGLVSDSNPVAGRAFQYGESYFLVDTLRAWNVSAMDMFTPALQNNDTEAYDFYRATQGLEVSSSLGGVMAGVAGTGVFMWMAFPIIIGLLFSQVTGVIAWFLLPLALFALIVPTSLTKRLALGSAKTILYATFASVLFSTILNFALFIYTMVLDILVPDPDEGYLQFVSYNTNIRWLATILASVLSFWIVKKFTKQFFTNDPLTIRGAAKTATQIANRPLMNERGTAEDNMGMRRPSWMSRASSYAAGALATEGTRAARAGIATKLGGGGSDAAESIMKDAAEDTTGKAAVGAGAAAAGAAGAAAAGAGTGKPGDGKKGEGERKPDQWRTATGAAAAAAGAAASSAGAKPPTTTPQARGKFAVDPEDGTVTIPKDGTISAIGGFPDEATVAAASITPEQRDQLSPEDKRAYMFDPATGRFLPKTVPGLSSEGVSEDVIAPMALIGQTEAPEGVSQDDWDRTAAMRAEILAMGVESGDTPERRSLIEQAAQDARPIAAAAGTPLPDSPDPKDLVQQVPGIAPMPTAGAQADNGAVLARHENGAPKTVASGDTATRQVTSEYDEDGLLTKRTYRKEDASVEREYDEQGNTIREVWRDKDGNEHRADGPAVVEFKDGNKIAEAFYLAGQKVDKDQHVAAAKESGPAAREEATQEAATTALGAMSGLDAVQQHLIAQGAARAVLDDPRTFASVTNADPARVQRAAESVMASETYSPNMESLVRMVNEHGRGQSADDMRRALIEAAQHTGVMPAQQMQQAATPAVAAVPVLTALDAAQQQALAVEASRLVQQNPDMYASLAQVTAADLARDASAVADGRATEEVQRRFVQMVREHGLDERSQQFRGVVDSMSTGGGAARVQIDAEMEALQRHMEELSQRHRDARTVSIQGLIERETQQIREQADMEMRAVNNALAEQFSRMPSGKEGSDAIARAQSEALRQRAEVEERMANRLNTVVDRAGQELRAAQVPESDLAVLRDSRMRVRDTSTRLRGVRAWFQH